MIELRTVGVSRRTAGLRLLCLPYAGGSSSVFADWYVHLPSDVEVRAPVLPGRESRIREAPFERLDDYVAALDEAIRTDLDGRPWALFGHSLGAQVAYQVTAARAAAGRQLPELLIVSGREAPGCLSDGQRVAHLPRDEFIREIGRLDGTPQELLDNDELMQLLLPALRADFRMIEDHHPAKHDPLPVPIVALAGQHDRDARPIKVARWVACTERAFRIVVIRGGHFFLRERSDEVLAVITSSLDGLAAGRNA